MNMKRLDEIEAILQKHKKELEQKFKVKEIGIFGSYVRGEAKETSDVDILVDFYEVPSLLKFIELEEYLEEILGVKVDLVMKSALKPRIAEIVLREVVYI
ncbi:type VII toxin-antitoxin system antitoxin protein adenylyltransferase MntA [Thermococcus sp.]